MIGIVAEFNPFHKGHKSLIDRSRECLEDDYIVSVMSGDFVQRGEPAVLDKFTRAEMAVKGGCSLVVELPVIWSLSSAEHFAEGAISILDSIGCSHLAFGSEAGDIDILYAAADKVSEKLSDVKEFLSKNHNYTFPEAMRVITGLSVLDSPNNLLAVEYLKAINKLESKMKPFTVKRTNVHDGPSSAMYIRSKMVRPNLDQAILSRLKMFDKNYFNSIPDSADGAGNRLYMAVRSGWDIDSIYEKTKTRSYTMSRVRRMAMCACLGIKEGMCSSEPPYARVLAFDDKGRKMLSSLKKSSKIPILTAPKYLKRAAVEAENSFNVFSIGALAHDFYLLGSTAQNNANRISDWQKNPIIVKNIQ